MTDEQPQTRSVKDALRDAIKNSIKYHPINPAESYDKDKFLNAGKGINALADNLEAIKKDAGDHVARDNLETILLGKRELGQPSITSGMPADEVRAIGDEYLNFGKVSMIGYVNNNYPIIKEKLNDKSLEKLVSALPLSTNGDDKHNSFVELINEYKKLYIGSEDDQEKVFDETIKKIAMEVETDDPATAKLIARFFGTKNQYLVRLFMNYKLEIGKAYEETFKKDNGKNLREVFDKSRSIVVNDPNRINEANAYNLSIAHFFYEQEKK